MIMRFVGAADASAGKFGRDPFIIKQLQCGVQLPIDPFLAELYDPFAALAGFVRLHPVLQLLDPSLPLMLAVRGEQDLSPFIGRACHAIPPNL